MPANQPLSTASCVFGLSLSDARQEPLIELGDETFDTSLPRPPAARSGRRLIPRPSETVKPTTASTGALCERLFVHGLILGFSFERGKRGTQVKN